MKKESGTGELSKGGKMDVQLRKSSEAEDKQQFLN